MASEFTATDRRHMTRALQLAHRGQGWVEPNPMVGCVLVRRGQVVGDGYHRRFGGPHAEAAALIRAGANARGATAYVTLEPCCHHGKTPPCTEALIAAGVRRVVVAMSDPFPEVNGSGITGLRRAGLRVDLGLLEQKARELNAPFVSLVTRGRPYVVLKWAQSLDGKIATRKGDSQWISSSASRAIVHRVRARVDAVLVGVNTALTDDPQLTARDVRVRRRAVRVVLDSGLRIPLKATLVATAKTFPTLVLTTRAALTNREAKARRLRRAGVEVVGCGSKGGRVSLRAAVNLLGDRRLTNLLVEGGGTVLGAFLDERLADEAMVFVAPLLIGGEGAVSACRGRGAALVRESLSGSGVKTTRVGDDLLYRVRFADSAHED